VVFAIVLLEGVDLYLSRGGEREHEGDVGIDEMGVGLDGAGVGEIAVGADDGGIGWCGTEDLFLTLEEQAVAGPVFEVDACDVHMEQILDELLLLLPVSVGGWHGG
jgi:hypothetical protein